MGKHGIVAAGHRETVEAARLILEDGGNAFDASLAALCAAFVCEPILSSLAGGGFLLAHDGTRARLFDFFTQTPRQRRPEEQLDFFPIVADFGSTHQEFHIGAASIATPGVAKGLFEAHRALGTLPMRRIVEPAVELARKGVPMSTFQASVFRIIGPIYRAEPDTLAVFRSALQTEQLIGEGEVLRLPELADTLETLAIEGERLFYEGEIGKLLVDYCESTGGHLCREDLSTYRVEVREPLTIDHGKVRLFTNPPPSSGGVLIALALRLLEQVNIAERQYGSAEHLALLTAVVEQTNKARVESGLRDLPPTRQAAALLDPQLVERYQREVLGRYACLRGTTHISVVDAGGRAASLTISNGEGNGYLIPGTGIMCNNMLGEEDINPHGFHRWPLDQRMASMMAPTVALWRDGRVAALGSGGSNRIRTAILQVLSNLMDFGMDMGSAVEAPRLHFENEFLDLEHGFSEPSIAAITQRYPKHRVWQDRSMFFGGVHAAESGPDGMRGAGDPRRDGFWARV